MEPFKREIFTAPGHHPICLVVDVLEWRFEVDRNVRTMDGSIDLRFTPQVSTRLAQTDVEHFVGELEALREALPEAWSKAPLFGIGDEFQSTVAGRHVKFTSIFAVVAFSAGLSLDCYDRERCADMISA